MIMTVQELIDELKQFDPECKVMIEADRVDIACGYITSVSENYFAKEPIVEITYDW